MTIGLLPDGRRTPAGRLPDALKPGIHCVRTHWIRGFIAFGLVRAHPDRDADGASVT
jgi:hypothetical protein